MYSIGSLGPKVPSHGERRLWSDCGMPRQTWVFAGRTSHVCWFCYRLPWLQSFFAFIFIMIFHIKLMRILNWRLMFYLWLAPLGFKLVDLFQCPNVILIVCGFVVFTTGRFVWSLALHFVLVLLFFFFQSCLALWSPRLGKRELIYVLFVHLFVYFACVDFCPFSLPLGVRDWLRFVIVALPGFFY